MSNRDRIIHILVVHYDLFRDQAEEAADLIYEPPKIKPLEWREMSDGGYAGFAGDRAWGRVDVGWCIAEPYEVGTQRFVSLDEAKKVIEGEYFTTIRSVLDTPAN